MDVPKSYVNYLSLRMIKYRMESKERKMDSAQMTKILLPKIY